MATENKNLSEYKQSEVPSGASFRIGVAVSQWNGDITGALLKGALEVFDQQGVKNENLFIAKCPGAFELPLTAQWLLEEKKVDGVITIGSVIQGETKHFDFVCDGVAQGVKDLNLKFSKPVIFCVLTDNNLQQAIDRSGGKHGNKGIECAVALLQMIDLKKSLTK